MRDLVVAGLLLFIGCGEDAGGSRPSTAEVPPGTPVTVSDDPSLVLGTGGDGAEEFAGVVSPLLLGDSLLVVPSRLHSEIRVFSRDGKHLRSYGRAGQGPGEFGMIGGVWFRGDTIEALDISLQRVTRFLPDGTPDVTVLQGPFVIWGVGPVGDGWFFVNLAHPGLSGESPRDEWAMYTFGWSGQRLASLGTVEGIRRFLLGGRVATDPWTPSARFAVAAGKIYVGDTLVPEVRVLGEDGQLLRKIDLDIAPTVNLSEALADVRHSLRTGSSPSDEREVRLQAAPHPEELPYFTDILVDDEGFLWVRPYEPVRDATVVGGRPDVHVVNSGGQWKVFSPSGTHLGSVRVPENLAPYHITSNAIVGVSRDEFDVESVRIHDLVRR